MNDTSLVGLVQNAALLLAMAFLFDLTAIRCRTGQSSFRQIPVGLALGAIGIIVMLTPWSFGPGIVFDTRSVLLGISGLFFGSVSTAIAMAITAAFRFYQGGTGAWTGVAVILVSGLIGIAWRHSRRRPLAEISQGELYLFGVVIHLAMLGLMLTLPWATALRVLSSIALPVILIYPLGTALLGVLMVNRLRRERAEETLRYAETRYRLLFEHSPDGIVIIDPATARPLEFNESACQQLGYSREEFADLSILDIEADEKSEATRSRIAKVMGGGRDDFDTRQRTKQGEIRDIHVTAQITEILGHPVYHCIWRDITDRKKSEEELRLSEERFKRIFEEGPIGMGLESPDHTIIAMNKVFCELLGYTEQELAGQSIADITYEEDREKSKEFLGQLFANRIPMFRLEKRYVRKDGAILWANTTMSAIHGKEGNVLYGLAIIEDLTESRKAADKIHLLAYYDSLTGLPNRTFHKELIKRAIEYAQRHKEIFALIYIGLDNFQRINDTLGHNIGDLLLKAVADRLTNSLRKSDYIARSDEGQTVNVVSRVGGDEFIVLAHDLTQSQDAAKTSRRLLEEISAPYDLSGRKVFITASIGISLYPDDGTDVDDLLKNAEKAMRHTKSEGKNNYHFYSSLMHSSVLELLTMESDLHKALERNELVLYYQPKVDAATRMVKGMEALIRWVHPDKGLIPPMQFIPLAETSGLIIPIGEFIIRTVCGQIKTWQEAGYKQMNIALNVSSRQFDQQNLIEIVKEALQDAMISPQCLELEITERTIVRNPEKAIRTLTELKAMGIQIAIDDFGTGYSSLSYLKRLPLDFLKIDQSFVKSLASDPSDQAIVRAIIAMAHSLNLKTIAEGVETEEQLSFLQEHGCDEIQGYLFSRPLPAEAIPGILAKGYL
jgi:diguanylate cyclase (GGDEF)-like protein/PAS domain S-box-containing protein